MSKHYQPMLHHLTANLAQQHSYNAKELTCDQVNLSVSQIHQQHNLQGPQEFAKWDQFLAKHQNTLFNTAPIELSDESKG